MTDRSRPRRSTAIALFPVIGAVVAVAVVAYLLARNPTLGMPQTNAAPVSTTSTAAETTEPTPTTASPSSTSTPTATAGASGLITDPETLMQRTVYRKALAGGPAPGIAWFVAPAAASSATTGYIHPPNDAGPAIPVQLDQYQVVRSFTQFRSGYLLVVNTAEDTEIRYYKSNGRMVQMAPLQPTWTKGLARDADGSVAVSLNPGQVTLFDASGKESHTWTFPTSWLILPVRILPDQGLVVDAMPGHGTKVLRLDPGGGVITLPSPDRNAVDVNPVNGDLSISAGHLPGAAVDLSQYAPCPDKNKVLAQSASVFDGSAYRPLWIDCHYLAGTFSPDGKTVAALTDRHLWAGGQGGIVDHYTPGFLGIIDANTGTVLVRFDAMNEDSGSSKTIRAIAWEDDSHVLAYSIAGDLVLRFGLDGSIEKAAVTVPRFGYLLLEQTASSRQIAS